MRTDLWCAVGGESETWEKKSRIWVENEGRFGERMKAEGFAGRRRAGMVYEERMEGKATVGKKWVASGVCKAGVSQEQKLGSL